MRAQFQAVSRSRFSYASPCGFEDRPNRADARLAALGAVDLRETPKRELEPNEIVHATQRPDRQLGEARQAVD